MGIQLSNSATVIASVSEAIHRAAKRKGGLLRRFRLRSLRYGGQVAPRNDGKIWVRDLAACFSREVCLKFLTLEERAQGMPGARCARSLVGRKG
jgi:hypothetical protein